MAGDYRRPAVRLRAQPEPGVALCQVSDLADPGAKGFVFRDGDFMFLGFLVRVGDDIFGWVDRCPHAGLPLAVWQDQYLTRDGDLILCGSHGALFRRQSGLCIGGPCAGRSLLEWPVEVRDGAVLTA